MRVREPGREGRPLPALIFNNNVYTSPMAQLHSTACWRLLFLPITSGQGTIISSLRPKSCYRFATILRNFYQFINVMVVEESDKSCEKIRGALEGGEE